MKKIFLIFFIFTLLLISTSDLFAANVQWTYFETANFKVIFHNEVQEQAYQVAEIAESVFASQSKFTGFTPYRKIAIIVSGLDDFANGYALPRDVMKVWVNPLLTSTRVDQDWLKNLVTHELTHVLQTEATFGYTYFIQKLTHASTPLGLPPNSYNPLWFLEGAAQYGAARQGYDQIDRKRQMIMEQRINSDQFYTNAELYWGRGNIAGEGFYNFGFGFFDFLMRKYGEKKFLQLQKAHSSFYFLGIENTIRIIYHKKLSDLLAEWKKELRANFPVREDKEVALPIAKKSNMSEWKEPLVRPDGSVIFLEIDTNRPDHQVKYWDATKGLRTIFANPTLDFSRLAIAPDGNRLLYTAYHLNGQLIQFDLYELNLLTGKRARITRNQRIIQGEYFADGYLLIKNDFGKTQLYYLANDKMTKLTEYDYNFAISDLAISPDQKRLALNFNYNGKRGIGIISTDTWKFAQIYYPNEGLDWLLGEFIDNQNLTLSSDRLSHYDLYKLQIETGEMTRLTDTREDIMHGQIYQTNGETFWCGQIYGPNGFHIAQGKVANYETFTINPSEANFESAPTGEPKIIASGKYTHFTQLRNELLSPYFDSTETRVGFAQVLMDPLMELQLIYDLGWNYSDNIPEVMLQANWTGTNPGCSLAFQSYGTDFEFIAVESYKLYPYSIAFSQVLNNEDSFSLDTLQMQLTRSWITAFPGATALQGSYHPRTLNRDSGYTLFIKHSQQIPLGYNGDSLTLQTHIGTASGSARIGWGTEGYLWVYPEKRTAERALYQSISYRHNLIDLSANLNLVQTGRLYANISAEGGVFYEDNNYRFGNMLVGGLELETMIMNVIGINLTVDAAINSNADWDVRYDFASPF